MLGLNSAESVIGAGISDASIPCPAAELTDQFAAHDKRVVETKSNLRLLEYVCYAKDQWKVFLQVKFPVLDSKGHLQAIGLNALDISNSNLAIMNYDLLLNI